MLRPEHNSGLRIAFPQVRADLLFLTLTTLAAIALALILSEPARENAEIAVSRFHALSKLSARSQLEISPSYGIA
jgi:hypothetical protein